MTDPRIASAIAVARLRAVRLQLLDLHKTLIDIERGRYERAHGRVENPAQILRLLVEDPWFAWLRPLAQLIVQIDTRMADEPPLQARDLDGFVAETRALLQSAGSDRGFGESYQRILQDVPDVVVAHGRLMTALTTASH